MTKGFLNNGNTSNKNNRLFEIDYKERKEKMRFFSQFMSIS